MSAPSLALVSRAFRGIRNAGKSFSLAFPQLLVIANGANVAFRLGCIAKEVVSWSVFGTPLSYNVHVLAIGSLHKIRQIIGEQRQVNFETALCCLSNGESMIDLFNRPKLLVNAMNYFCPGRFNQNTKTLFLVNSVTNLVSLAYPWSKIPNIINVPVYLFINGPSVSTVLHTMYGLYKIRNGNLLGVFGFKPLMDVYFTSSIELGSNFLARFLSSSKYSDDLVKVDKMLVPLCDAGYSIVALTTSYRHELNKDSVIRAIPRLAENYGDFEPRLIPRRISSRPWFRTIGFREINIHQIGFEIERSELFEKILEAYNQTERQLVLFKNKNMSRLPWYIHREVSVFLYGVPESRRIAS